MSCCTTDYKLVFHFNRIVTKRSVFREQTGRTNDMDTLEYATFCYDTVKVENGLWSLLNQGRKACMDCLVGQCRRDTDLNYWIKHPFEFSDSILKPEYL